MIKLKLILTIFTPDCSFDWQREKIVNEEQKKMNQILFDIGGRILKEEKASSSETTLLKLNVEFPRNDVQTARKILNETFGTVLKISY